MILDTILAALGLGIACSLFLVTIIAVVRSIVKGA